jgi:ADP-heptose:LPS heptosyltransferase
MRYRRIGYCSREDRLEFFLQFWQFFKGNQFQIVVHLLALQKTFTVTVQSCIKTVVFVIARSVLCDEAIPRRSSWPEKREIASPENGSQ